MCQRDEEDAWLGTRAMEETRAMERRIEKRRGVDEASENKHS